MIFYNFFVCPARSTQRGKEVKKKKEIKRLAFSASTSVTPSPQRKSKIGGVEFQGTKLAKGGSF